MGTERAHSHFCDESDVKILMITTEELNLLTSESIPSDCDLLIIERSYQ
jgi:hypothetical protein